jgi:hypothetical protein
MRDVSLRCHLWAIRESSSGHMGKPSTKWLVQNTKRQQTHELDPN